jgi:hypothetical protein
LCSLLCSFIALDIGVHIHDSLNPVRSFTARNANFVANIAIVAAAESIEAVVNVTTMHVFEVVFDLMSVAFVGVFILSHLLDHLLDL